MQNTLKVATALGLEGKPEERIAKVRSLFTSGTVPTEFKKGAAVTINGVELKDEKDAPITGSAIRAAADELGFKLQTTSVWVG